MPMTSQNDRLFPPPAFLIDEKDKDLTGELSFFFVRRRIAKTLVDAKTAVFVKRASWPAGRWVSVISGAEEGPANADEVTTCLVDVRSPAQRRVMVARFTPGEHQSTTLIDGIESTERNTKQGTASSCNCY